MEPAFYVGKGIRLPTNRLAFGSFRRDYIHLPRTLANKPFLTLEGRQAAIIRDQSQNHDLAETKKKKSTS